MRDKRLQHQELLLSKLSELTELDVYEFGGMNEELDPEFDALYTQVSRSFFSLEELFLRVRENCNNFEVIDRILHESITRRIFSKR